MPDWNSNLLSRLSAIGQDKRLPVLVLLLMAGLLAYAMALMTWEILPDQTQEFISMPADANKTSRLTGEQNTSNISDISQWHLFGQVEKVSASRPVEKAIDAPDTRLNLKLSGILASSNLLSARAIIMGGKGSEDSYAIGDDLPGNAVLREIYTDRVILEYRGRLETLRLPKETLANARVSFASNKRSTKTSSRFKRAAGNANTSNLLRQYRDALMTNPQSLMNLINVSPVTDKNTGRLKGYRIRPGKDRTLLKQFGLKNGDVVTGVNGIPLDNPIKALEIMRDLSTASAVTLEVERNGIIESFVFQID